MSSKIRQPTVAGTFYPAEKSELRSLIGECLDTNNSAKDHGKIVALVSPHAGLIYSGKVAGFGYDLLKGSGVSKVIILAPSHSGFWWDDRKF